MAIEQIKILTNIRAGKKKDLETLENSKLEMEEKVRVLKNQLELIEINSPNTITVGSISFEEFLREQIAYHEHELSDFLQKKITTEERIQVQLNQLDAALSELLGPLAN